MGAGEDMTQGGAECDMVTREWLSGTGQELGGEGGRRDPGILRCAVVKSAARDGPGKRIRFVGHRFRRAENDADWGGKRWMKPLGENTSGCWPEYCMGRCEGA
jgi:hypothetical protein